MTLRPTRVRKLVKVLAKMGFSLERVHGSHMIFKHVDGRITVVPRHGKEEIGRGLLRQIASELRISPDELARMIDEV